MYEKFTAATGIKVNLINGKSGALEKRIAKKEQILQLIFILLLMLEDVVLWKPKVCFKVVYHLKQ
jgi:hypothetical protein